MLTDRSPIDLAVLLDLSDALMVVMDVEGVVTHGNATWMRMLGVPADKLIGARLDDWLHPDDDPRLLQDAAGHIAERVTLRVRRADGCYCWFRWAVAQTADGSTYAVGEDMQRERELESEVRSHEMQLSRLLTYLYRSTEEHRLRFADAFHDEVLQELMAARISLDDVGRDVATNTAFTAVADSLSRASHRLRELLHTIMPFDLENQTLGVAIGVHVASLDLGDVVLDLDLDEAPEVVDRNQWIVAYRCAVWAIDNALVYAHARRIHVSARRSSAGELELEVTDDGKGFQVSDATEASLRGQIGIAFMREQVRDHAGVFDLRSSPGAGTSIRVVLPSRVT